MDHLAPPPDLPANARAILSLWSVKDDVRTLSHASQWPDWDPYQLHRLSCESGIKVLDAPAEYPQYAPGYYAVYFEDSDGLKFEVVHMPEFPT
jgi:hypothetical protein